MGVRACGVKSRGMRWVSVRELMSLCEFVWDILGAFSWMQCPTVIMSKTPVARFDLWTSKVHKFSAFQTCFLPEPKTQLFEMHFLVHFFIYARFRLQKDQTNAHLVWQHQSKEGVGISENNGEQLSSKRIMGTGWKGTQREVIKNSQVLYKVVLKTGSDDAISFSFWNIFVAQLLRFLHYTYWSQRKMILCYNFYSFCIGVVANVFCCHTILVCVL